MSTSTEPYNGNPRIPELRSAAQKFLSNETSRAVLLFLDGKDRQTVAADNGKTKKVVNDLKVAENVVTGRVVHQEAFALRRTARACRQMLASRSLGINTRTHLEYLWERTCAEAARLGYAMAKVDRRRYER